MPEYSTKTHRRNYVLVVEDDPLVRLSASELAENAGLQVMQAADSKEALSILERFGNIGVMLTDVLMVGPMNGLELANVVRERWPDIQIIVISGAGRPKAKDLPAGALFFPKPFNVMALTQALRRHANPA